MWISVDADIVGLPSMLRAVNSVADAIADEFPYVVVDTLAYQYTRPAPNITVPGKNVVIRLCSIECNFAAPLVRLTAFLTHCLDRFVTPSDGSSSLGGFVRV